MKKFFKILPILLMCLFCFTGCFETETTAPYIEEYVYVLDGAIQTNSAGQQRRYFFTTSGGAIFEKIQVTICYKNPGEEPAPQSIINVSCTRVASTYTITWGLSIFKQTEVWDYDATNNEFVRTEEGKKLIAVSNLGIL